MTPYYLHFLSTELINEQRLCNYILYGNEQGVWDVDEQSGGDGLSEGRWGIIDAGGHKDPVIGEESIWPHGFRSSAGWIVRR